MTTPLKSLLASALAMILLGGNAGATAARETSVATKPLDQTALLLDTSNSTNGPNNQARSQLWNTVNQ